MSRWVALLLLPLMLLTLSQCRNSSVLARLDRRQNTVERDERASVGRWKPADRGSEFLVGDGVRTGARSTADLRLSDGSALHLDESTLLRFLERKPGSAAPGLNLEFGGAELSAVEEDFSIEAAFGIAHVGKGGRVRIARSSEGARFEVTIGSADVTTKQGKRVVLKVGQPLDIDVSGAAQVSDPTQAAHERDKEARVLGTDDPLSIPTPESGAILAEVKGAGVRARGSGQKDWRDLPPGKASLSPGATLRIPAASVVGVSRQRERTTLRGPGDFTLGAEGQPLVEAKSGSAELTANDEPLSLEVPGGTIVVNPRSRADLVLDDRGVHVNVPSGTVSLLGTRDRADLRAGEQARLEHRGAVDFLRRYGPPGADVMVDADAGFIVHDPEPPTVLGFSVDGKCPGAGLVELGRGRGALPATLGIGTVNVALPAGAHEYTLRCAGEDANQAPLLRGKILVLRDAGMPRLPKVPADTSIDVDGRRYTIMYQSTMPRIVVRWPSAPAGQDFQLAVQSETGSTHRVHTTGPVHAFTPGMLPEGAHVLTFEGGGQRSRPTTLVIRFDNAAKAASIASPADKSFQRGQRVVVIGAALAGWQVSVGGMPLHVDSAFRFAEDVTVPTSQRALVIRLQNPQRGTHYYLRRAAGGSGS